MTFKRILFPVDLSERSRAVAPFVRALAERHQATLILATFVEMPTLWCGAADVPIVPDMSVSRLVEEAEHNLTFFVGEFFTGLETTIHVEEGDPGVCIVDLARVSGTDLIMMPARGRGRFRAALLGSVTAKVLHDAEIPVWTAAHTETPEHAISSDWHRVVCAIDSSDEATGLIRGAQELAVAEGADIRLVHAVPAPPEAGQERYFDRDLDVFLKESARKTIAQMQKDAGTGFNVCLGAGSVSTVVAAAALDHRADLVIAGRGALPHFGGRLRTHLYSIIRDVKCPVLSI